MTTVLAIVGGIVLGVLLVIGWFAWITWDWTTRR